ncbi:hypothetical protein GCM10010406_31130 [Streptomyces thermolineatus]|uniref:Uncharacterized protein n=2 Tax=Streptomyces TaxID=1883 RepID=A0ABP5Z5H2_9ACTN
MLSRSIANPRRTTLAHLKDAETPKPGALAGTEEPAAEALPSSTANPRRTVLMDLPTA